MPCFTAERAAQERGLEILDEEETTAVVPRKNSDEILDNAGENDGTYTKLNFRVQIFCLYESILPISYVHKCNFCNCPSLTVVNVHIYKQITGIMQKLKYIYTYNDIQKIIF